MNIINVLVEHSVTGLQRVLVNHVIPALNSFIRSKQIQVLADDTTISWDVSGGYNASVTLGGNRMLAISSMEPGDYGTIKIIQDATGSRTLTLPANSKVANGGAGALTLTSAPNSEDIVTFYYDGVSFNWNFAPNFN